jgi:hypothetical protein
MVYRKKVLISPEAIQNWITNQNTICKSYAGKNKTVPILKQTNLFQEVDSWILLWVITETECMDTWA